MRIFFQRSRLALAPLLGLALLLTVQGAQAQDQPAPEDPSFGSPRFGERFTTGVGSPRFDASATAKRTYFIRAAGGFAWFQGQGADLFFNLATDFGLSFGYYWEALGVETDLRWQNFTGSGNSTFPTDAPWNQISLMAGPSYMLLNIRSLSFSTHALAGGLVGYSSSADFPQVAGLDTGGPAVQVGANLFFAGPNLASLGNPYARGYNVSDMDDHYWDAVHPVSIGLRYDLTYVLGNNLFDMLIHSLTATITIRDTEWKKR